jgi:hypothetical protein
LGDDDIADDMAVEDADEDADEDIADETRELSLKGAAVAKRSGSIAPTSCASQTSIRLTT